MRLIDLDAIMAQFPDADFDGDVIENMKAYPYWKIGIDGLINVLKAVPIIEQSEDCVSRDEVLKDQLSVYTKEYGEIDVVAVEYIESLPSVTPSYNSINTELKPCEDVLDEIITQIEQVRDKDRIAEYPYNRCIRIVEEYKNEYIAESEVQYE